MSSKLSKAAALKRFQKAKASKHATSALDDYDANDDNDNVYEMVTEEEYIKVVESRRQRDDFVVDDDGLGYLDDGEEHVFDRDDDTESHKKATTHKKSSSAALTAQALKQARKQRAAASATCIEDGGAMDKNRSMWEFVNKPNLAAAPEAPKAASSVFSNQNNNNKRSLDALLSELDHDDDNDIATTASSTRRRSATTSRSWVSKSSRTTSSSRRAAASRNHSRQAASVRDTTTDFADNDYDYNEDDHNVGDFCGNDDDMQVDSKEPGSSTKSVRFANDTKASDTCSPGHDDMQIDEDKVASPKAAPRRMLARPKLTLSEPARLALKRKQAQATPTTASDGTGASSSSQNGSSNLLYQDVLLPTELTMSGTVSSASSSNSSQVDLEKLVTKTTSKTTNAESGEVIETEETFVDFFWMDLAERKNGDILLFGKVPLTSSNKTTKYISACALVTGNVRNLFALPRQPDGMLEVHQEINRLLHSSILLPRKPGVSWAGKPVTRTYAFEDAAIPREPTKYLKIVYDAKYPMPSEEICQEGGEHFSKIINAGASIKETFILKRKLMGPCWVRISNPKASQSPLSWCQAELQVDSPKQIVRLDLVNKEGGGPPRPPPPVVTMSLKIHTMVHPKTHQSEIVAVAAVCHNNVLLDSTMSEQSMSSPRDMAHLTLIRPLPQIALDSADGSARNVTSKPTMGIAQFPRDLDREIQANMPQLKRETNERALISRLLVQIGLWDPDVIVAHNAWGFEMEVLLNRCIEHKLKSVWSKVGRRRCSDLPNKSHFASRRDIVILEAMSGRLLCDTYLSAQENLRETTYSLSSLAASQLKFSRQEIEPADTPQWFESSKSIVQLAARTLVDAQLVQRLMFKLQTLPLSKQLTCVAGNIWSHTLKSNRAERTEYLLLHEFHRLKYLAPEKRRGGKTGLETNKAKYSGGLVLEPKKGLYDSYILLLDFNSLYPSIIQEYNLCFTTIDWSKFTGSAVTGEGDAAGKGELPPLPDSDSERGVLPRVIKSLVDRRRAVKRFMKEEKDADKKEELNIRQTALKLTANSMYGCLGFSNSRFYAQPIAALVTAMGRETLQRTVDIAQHTVGLDVIYGDTDSIMINTRLTGDGDLKQVKKLGEQVKQEVNKLYNTLELEIDGVFKPMLLLKKKKYAANTVEELPNGEIKIGQELKGLDLVRRDWCVQSRDTGRYVTEQILSGQDSEIVFQNIFSHLEELAAKMRSGELALEKYVITKGLSKHPNEYPDAKAQPHVQVAKMMLANNRAVNKGDHIPYIVTAPLQQEGDDPNAKTLPAAERARHPEEVARSDGVLKPDVEWYLTQQILPPISRLCDPIEACSPDILADKLGLDAKRYNQSNGQRGSVDDDEIINYTPASFLPDKERFKDVTKLEIYCAACNEKNCISGVFDLVREGSSGVEAIASGLCCVNPACPRPPLWGHKTHLDLFARIQNAMSIWTRGLTIRYYQGVMQCSEPGCSLKTRQLSVAGGGCLRRGCTGRLHAVQTERAIHTHLKYLETLFDVNHACDQLEETKKFGRKVDLLKTIPSQDKVMFDELHSVAKDTLGNCLFNWISPAQWSSWFVAKQ